MNRSMFHKIALFSKTAHSHFNIDYFLNNHILMAEELLEETGLVRSEKRSSIGGLMLRKSLLLILPILFILASCSQAPAPEANEADALPELEALTFGSSGNDYTTNLAKHSTGVYVIGGTTGNLHGTPQGNYDIFIRKYDNTGAVLWGKQFGTPSYDGAEGVASDASDNAYVVGMTGGSLAGSRGAWDVFIRKYNASGSVAWTKQFGTDNYDNAGDVAVSGSNIYVVGNTGGSLAGGSYGSYDAFIRKYNSSGSVVWTKQFGTPAVDNANDVAVDGSGNIYVAGTTYGSLAGTYTNGGGGDMFLRKYNPNGGVVWTKQLHYSDGDTGVAVTVSGSNVYLVGGFWYNNNYTDTDVRVVKFTTDGALVWSYGWGPVGEDYVYDASVDSDGNLYFAGVTRTSFGGPNQGGADGYIYKLSSSGYRVWSKQIGTSADDGTYSVLARSTSQVYVAGDTRGILGSTYSGGIDAYLRRLKGSDGATVWTDQ